MMQRSSAGGTPAEMNQARPRVEEAGRHRVLDGGEANGGGDGAASGSGVVGDLARASSSKQRKQVDDGRLGAFSGEGDAA